MLTWTKHKIGMGDWLRGKTEHCLMCVKGKPAVTLTNQTTCHPPVFDSVVAGWIDDLKYNAKRIIMIDCPLLRRAASNV